MGKASLSSPAFAAHQATFPFQEELQRISILSLPSRSTHEPVTVPHCFGRIFITVAVTFLSSSTAAQLLPSLVAESTTTANTKDALYQSLPARIKLTLPSKIPSLRVVVEDQGH
ncbi:hypothetical protein Fmac_020789 [Flemingia macrophylla]|uniref:DUF668 domain-containing protein n=1 Tax=Flemingia macrophylla TaxID=520843 RepID=A0ABD1LV78_9FABA